MYGKQIHTELLSALLQLVIKLSFRVHHVFVCIITCFRHAHPDTVF